MPDDQRPIQPIEEPILCSPYAEPRRYSIYATQTGIPSEASGRRDATLARKVY